MLGEEGDKRRIPWPGKHTAKERCGFAHAEAYRRGGVFADSGVYWRMNGVWIGTKMQDMVFIFDVK